MKNKILNKGSFTLPGEAGYEDLTLSLAEQWGADVIRDSDGTVLSDKIVSSGYDIYSTLCLVRSDNTWAKANMDKLQQNYLMSFPVIAKDCTVIIDPLKGYFREQFIINSKDDPKEWWQVFDRTTGEEVSLDNWEYDYENERITIKSAIKWHKYTVNFLVTRIWEEISMYNHITNDWGNKEHLMSIEPRYKESQKQILKFLENWLESHPQTSVVRFTSMFYNFCWFWGDGTDYRYIYSDWASYDFTVNPYAMKEFERVKGYKMKSEDFVNNGLYNSTHNVPSERYRDWMDFINSFVVEFGRKCIDLVHKYGKKAYVFYDDHWIGVEPYGGRFKDFNFDGIIKCVFNSFEARLCAGVEGVKTRELRLHPYLFPTGLTGEPTFKEGGNPTLDCKNYWVKIRRALLRAPVDRIGLGGYLHLVEGFPDFIAYMEQLINEFRLLKSFHEAGKPYTVSCRVAVLTSWGKLRSWICSGHLHEHPELELTRVIEALAGLPVEVEFISFEDIVKYGIQKDIKVIINAGRLDTAWSGGDNWRNPAVIEKITEWVANGGGFIGVGEPSAAKHSSQYIQMSHILGVERETGLSIVKNKYNYSKSGSKHFITEDLSGAIDFDKDVENIYIIEPDTSVLYDRDNSPVLTVRSFEKGRSVYLSGFKITPENNRLLHRVILWAAGCEKEMELWNSTNVNMECAYYAESKKLVIINNSGNQETGKIKTSSGEVEISIEPFGIKILEI